MKRNCIDCGINIPAARLKALPDTKVCVKCSKEKPIKDDFISDRSSIVDKNYRRSNIKVN